MKQIEMFMSTEDTQLTTLTSLTKRDKANALKAKWRADHRKLDWVQRTLWKAKQRAKRKNVPFALTQDYVMSIMTDHCPIFGEEFVLFGSKVGADMTPNIDRIDPAKGYVEGNIAIISSKANRIKSAYKSKDLYKVAQWLEQIEATSV